MRKRPGATLPLLDRRRLASAHWLTVVRGRGRDVRYAWYDGGVWLNEKIADMGFASALAWVLFVIIMALTLVLFRSGQFWVYYEGKRD